MAQKRLIINADDYGLAPGVNRGIEELMQSGAVTSASAFWPPDSPALAGRCGVHLKAAHEWNAQIDRFLKPTHLDSHHHTHGDIPMQGWYADLCEKYGAAGVPLSAKQRDMLRARGIECVDHVEIGWIDGTHETLERFLRVAFSWAESVHLMCHPGYVDDDLRRVSTMTHVRERELMVLMDPTFKIWLRSEGIELIGYAEL
jgi:chitin disaccharide deacetylase